MSNKMEPQLTNWNSAQGQNKAHSNEYTSESWVTQDQAPTSTNVGESGYMYSNSPELRRQQAGFNEQKSHQIGSLEFDGYTSFASSVPWYKRRVVWFGF